MLCIRVNCSESDLAKESLEHVCDGLIVVLGFVVGDVCLMLELGWSLGNC